MRPSLNTDLEWVLLIQGPCDLSPELEGEGVELVLKAETDEMVDQAWGSATAWRTVA